MSDNITPELAAATEHWDAMTKPERGVAVAHDVISLLKSNRICAESGLYLKAQLDRECKADDDLRQLLLESQSCHVCALGAVFVAKVTARNGITVGQANAYGGNNAVGCDRKDMVQTLSDAFEIETLDYIESAFEGGWKNEFEDDDNRLEAIMERVISNNGVFTATDSREFGKWYDDDYYDDDDWDCYDDEDDFDDYY